MKVSIRALKTYFCYLFQEPSHLSPSVCFKTINGNVFDESTPATVCMDGTIVAICQNTKATHLLSVLLSIYYLYNAAYPNPNKYSLKFIQKLFFGEKISVKSEKACIPVDRMINFLS